MGYVRVLHVALCEIIKSETRPSIVEKTISNVDFENFLVENQYFLKC